MELLVTGIVSEWGKTLIQGIPVIAVLVYIARDLKQTVERCLARNEELTDRLLDQVLKDDPAKPGG